VVDLTPAEMIVLLREQETHVEMDLHPGYVLLRYEGHLLGCGIYTPGRLRSLIPLRQVKHQHLPERTHNGHSGTFPVIACSITGNKSQSEMGKKDR
jgi:hypothetical protein